LRLLLAPRLPALTRRWYASARAAAEDAPATIRAIVGGRTRVEVTADAADAVAWAQQSSVTSA
jgi:hypothetical protein